MKSNKRTSVMNKNNKNTSIEWILNLIDTFPKYELQQKNMTSVQMNQFGRIQECDQILHGLMFTYVASVGKFVHRQFVLYPNMLLQLPYIEEQAQTEDFQQLQQPKNQISKAKKNISEDDLLASEYLILSTTLLQKKTIQYKEFQASGVILSNMQGQTYLFFENYMNHMNWLKSLKLFCKLGGFLNKFIIKEKIQVPNHFICTKNKNNKMYTVQVHRQTDLMKNYAAYEALMNEVNVLMCFKQQGLLQFHAIYEDQSHIYILYEYWTGETLFKLVQQGFHFNQIQIAQIVHQVLKVIKFLQINELYHGCLLPSNIVLLHTPQQNNQVKCTVINLAYREANQNDWTWLIRKLPRTWQPEESVIFSQKIKKSPRQIIHNCSNQVDPMKLDVYQVGSLIYYLTYFRSNPKQQTLSAIKALETMEIDYKYLESLQKQQLVQLGETQNQDPLINSQSQLNLMLLMLNPNPKLRINISEASKHHWFINQKSRSNSMKIDKHKKLASLRTILEIREQSEYEIHSSLLQKQEYEFESSSDSDSNLDQFDENDNLHRISKENNQLSDQLSYLNNQNIIKPSSKSKRY